MPARTLGKVSNITYLIVNSYLRSVFTVNMQYVLELMQKRADRRISLDEAIESLIDEYYSKRTKKES
jgi:predicted metallopeptidase